MLKFQNKQPCIGQAIIELVVVMGSVLVLLIILLPMLGKFIETSQSVDQASRYMAWERTVWFANAPSNTSLAAIKSNEDLEREIHWRFFSNNSAVLTSEDSSTNKAWSMSQNIDPMLATRQTKGNGLKSLISDKDKSDNKLVNASVIEAEVPGLLPTVNIQLDVMGLIGGFSVNQRGLQGSQINYAYVDIPDLKLFDVNKVEAQSEMFLLADGWNTEGRNHNVKMVKGLMPSAVIGDLGFLDDIRGLMAQVPFFRELDWLELGRVDTEQLPKQRLCRLDNRGKCRVN